MPYINSNDNFILGNGTATVSNPSVVKGRVPNNCHLFLEVTGTLQGTATITVKFTNGSQFIKPINNNTFDLSAADLTMTIINPTESVKVVINGAASDTRTKVVLNWYE